MQQGLTRREAIRRSFLGLASFVVAGVVAAEVKAPTSMALTCSKSEWVPSTSSAITTIPNEYLKRMNGNG